MVIQTYVRSRSENPSDRLLAKTRAESYALMHPDDVLLFEKTNPVTDLLEIPEKFIGTLPGRENSVEPPTYDKVVADYGSNEISIEVPHFYGTQRNTNTVLSAETAKEALIEYAKSRFTSNKKFAKKLCVTDLHESSLYVYNIQTLRETRTTRLHKEPCQLGGKKGDQLSGKKQQGNIDPWGVEVCQPAEFKPSTKYVEVPGTSYVTGCETCSGKGQWKCKECSRCPKTGKTPCQQCRDPYEKYNYQDYYYDTKMSVGCSWCCGTGYEMCEACEGKGQQSCKTCTGSGKIRHFRQVVVNRQILEDEVAMSKEYEISPKLKSKLQNIIANDVYTNEGVKINALSNSPLAELNQKSAGLLKQHADRCREATVVKQKHSVKRINVVKVTGEYKGEEYTYFICGKNNYVYAPKYPKLKPLEKLATLF